MKKTTPALGAVLTAIFLPLNAAQAIDVNFTVSPSVQQHTISPLIYGTNHRMYMTGQENLSFFRLGGNRLTAYNWETNWSSAGADWQHSSDDFMVPAGVNRSTPAITYTHFIQNDVAPGAKALLTVQMADYVAADGNGTVSVNETAPSSRWIPVYPRKNAAFSASPNLNDNAVYVDEMVNYLVAKFGRADQGGVFAYSLDNEPGLWSHTHPRIHPEMVGAQELMEKSIATASAVKDVDASAKIFGPALFGMGAYMTLADAPDWSSQGSNYHWFIDYYLDKMRAAGSNGTRLLDVLDLHWYSEATGDSRVIEKDATTRADKMARLQGTRSLWDAGYVENSWIGEWLSDELPLIPHVKSSIETWYPDTKLAFTEYSYGGGNDITGGVAQVDILGIFGKYDVYAANVWDDTSSYLAAAFRLYRNYDGAKSTFGDISVDATMSDKENSSIYASVDSTNDKLHVIVLNKNLDETIAGDFTISGTNNYTSAEVFAMRDGSTNIQKLSDISVSNNQFTYTIPSVSAYHLVFTKGAGTSASSSNSSSASSSSSSSSSSTSSSSSSSSTSSSGGTNSGTSGGSFGLFEWLTVMLVALSRRRLKRQLHPHLKLNG